MVTSFETFEKETLCVGSTYNLKNKLNHKNLPIEVKEYLDEKVLKKLQNLY